MNLSRKLRQSEKRRNLLVVLSGPSGVGKDTLLKRLIEVCPGTERAVTYTTRDPRPDEVAGVDYNFVSIGEFRRMAERGDFLEYAEVHGNLYGSSLQAIREAHEKGLDVVLKIDVQGGLTVKQKVPEAVMIFVAPPSLEALELRLRARHTDAEADVTRRLLDARREIEQVPKYQYLVVNDEVETAADKVRAIIVAERTRITSDDD